MTPAEIVDHFEDTWGPVPFPVISEAIAQRNAVAPLLVSVLHQVVDHPQPIIDGDLALAYTDALYLLAYFREPTAYPLVIKLARLPVDQLDALLGDAITEDLARILASVSDGDQGPLKDLIEDEEADEFVRGAAVEAMVTLVAAGRIERDELIGYFKFLMNVRLERKPSQVWNWLVEELLELHPAELMDEIRQAFTENLVDSELATFEAAEEAAQRDLAETLATLRKTHPLMEAPKDVHNTRDQEEVTPMSAEPKKTGRNDSCPCGSGKKFKKCCGNR